MKYLIVVEYEDNSGYTESMLYNLCSSIGNTLQLTTHSFLVSTQQGAVYIRDAFRNSPYILSSIYVSIIGSSAAWRNVKCDNSELKSFLNEQ